MSRIGSILIIFIIGLILVQCQFFHHVVTIMPQSILDNVSYQSIHRGLNELKTKLTTITEKILQTHVTVPKVVMSPEPVPVSESTNQSIDRTALTAENILYYTNLERTSRGLKPLKFSSKLTRSANAKNNDMFTYHYFAHESPVDKKKTFAYFIDNESYQFVRASENLAMGEFTTAKDVVKAWMDSPTHRANILFTDYRNIGASVQKGMLNGSSVIMIVQHFGIPKTACPSISSTVQKSLEAIEKDAMDSKKMAADLEEKINQKGSNWSDEELDGMIGIYNTTIRKYNELVKTFQNISKEYNTQVAQYDQCIKNLN